MIKFIKFMHNMKYKPIEFDTIVARSKDIPFNRLDEELLAVDPESGYCYALNATAGRIWELISDSVTVQAVCSRLCEEYTVDEATCRREVMALITELINDGLVVTKDPNAG